MKYSDFLLDKQFNINNVIYRFKNKINGKVYIGQTAVPFRKRVIQHITCSNPITKCYKSYFHRTLNKYKFENFDVSIIERCSNQQGLDCREKYWIAYYNSTNKKFGYNLESGGHKGKKNKGLSEEHKQKLLQAHLGVKYSNSTKKKISSTHKKLWQNKTFYEEHIHGIQKAIKCQQIPVYQYDLNGNFIKKWNSYKDVTLILYGLHKGNLSRNIKLNIQKNKLGFTKNGSIWSTISPTERGSYY